MAEVMSVTARFVLNTQQFKANLNEATAKARDSARRISTRFRDAARSVRQSFSSMTSAIRSNMTAIIASAAATGIAIRKIGQDIDRLAKFSRRLGVPIAVLQQFESAAGKSGLSIAELGTALEFFQKSTAEAMQGTGRLADQLRRANISVKQFVNLPLVERVDIIADLMASMGTEVQKTGLAVDAFGRSGQSMMIMLNSGSEGLRQLRKDFADVGYSITEDGAAKVEEMNDSLQRLGEALKATGQAMVVRLAPAINFVSKALTRMSVNARKSTVEILNEGLANIPGEAGEQARRQQAKKSQGNSSLPNALTPTIPALTNPIGTTRDTIGQVSTFFGTFKTGERDQLRLLDQIRKSTQDTVSAIRNQRGELT